MSNRFKPEDFKPLPTGGLKQAEITDDMKCILRVGGKCIAVVEEAIDRDGGICGHLIGSRFDSEGNCSFQVVALPGGLSLAQSSKAIVDISKGFFAAGCDYVGLVALALGARVEIEEGESFNSKAVREKVMEIASEVDGAMVSDLFSKNMNVLVSVLVMSQHSHRMWFAKLRGEELENGGTKMSFDGPWQNGVDSSDIDDLLRQVRMSAVAAKTKSKPSLN